MSPKPVDFQKAIQDIKLDALATGFENFKQELPKLFNLFEAMAAEIIMLSTEVQNLKDENNRLKGEQGKPDIRPQAKNKDISSEAERQRIKNKKKAGRKSKAKKHKITINRTVKLRIPKNKLPADAQFKGHETVVVQDLMIKTDNILFRKEIFYSPFEKKTYRAEMPAGYEGEFGPGVRSLVISLAASSGMTQPAIASFLEAHGIFISLASISRMLSGDLGSEFHLEKAEIIRSGMALADYLHIDDTTARVNGKNYYTHIICNPYFTAYVTQPRKDRMTILEILNQGKELSFKFGELAFVLMAEFGLPQKYLNTLQELHKDDILAAREMDALLQQMFKNPAEGLKSRQSIMEASAICAYQDSPEAIPILICDDAPQFKLLTQLLGLCWIHEGRHFKKLAPFLPKHQEILTQFLDDFWVFYEMLLYYKDTPTAEASELLSAIFDALFSKKTGYEQLDKRIALTLAKKTELLLVLKVPHIPLHNNPAELGARTQARSRDISLQTKSHDGTLAKDTLMTLVQTCKKLGVNVYNYIYDRISKTYSMPSLVSLMASISPCSDTS